MYIAFKWLLSLTFVMWIATCCIDAYVKKNAILIRDGYHIPVPVEFGSIKNKTVPAQIMFTHMNGKYNMTYWHCFTGIAGILVVLSYTRPNNSTMDIRIELYKFLKGLNTHKAQILTKLTIVKLRSLSAFLLKRLWVISKNLLYKSSNLISRVNQKIFQTQVNLKLLKQLKEIGQERKNLAQLLVAAIRENRNIRIQYQLENMAKNRLVRHMEDTQKIIKDNRSRYVSFQQLYLVTHQENTFLKFRIKKLTQEKADADRNLLELIDQIYKSKNNELKAYCSRFIVKTKDNLLNSDVAGEVQRFLRKSHEPLVASSNWRITEQSDTNINTASRWLRSLSCMQVTEINVNGNLEPLVSEAPKLKGLPGEYVWTVKDKDGIIEKLYEYDCESDLDNGETIRRIREYSVYHDKDCLLDFSNSSTIINETGSNARFWGQSPYRSFDCTLTSQRFLTGSEAFKKFMENNKNVVSTCILPATSRR